MKQHIIRILVVLLVLSGTAGCKFKKKIDMSEIESTEPEYEMGEYAVFTGPFDQGKAIVASDDGGFVVAALTRQKNKSYDDIWLIKLDRDGNKQWEKFFPVKGEDMIGAMLRAGDDGYIIAGSTFGKGKGQADAWIIRTDKKGELQWEKTYGDKGMERAESICATKDGGYIVAGYTTSKGAGGRDVWVIKLDKEGNMQWDKTFGGKKKDEGNDVKQTSDGGYVVVGYTASKGAGVGDFWVLKLDEKGKLQWDKVFGGEDWDIARQVMQAEDGGYIVAGRSDPRPGSHDAWIMKLDKAGARMWEQRIDGGGDDEAESMVRSSEGMFIVAGCTGEMVGNSYRGWAWIGEFDEKGEKVWDKKYDENRKLYAVIKAEDGEFAITGLGHDVVGKRTDVWVVKIDAKGEKLWDKAFGE